MGPSLISTATDILEAGGKGGANEAVWVALIANIALVMVAIINSTVRTRRLHETVAQVNDAVNHRKPDEPRLLDLVKMIHQQASTNAESHNRLQVDVQDIRHDLSDVRHDLRRIDGKVDILENQVECVDDKVEAHVVWEEQIRYGGEYGTSQDQRKRRPDGGEERRQPDPDEDSGDDLPGAWYGSPA